MDEKKKHRLPLSVKIFIWFGVFTLVLILLMWIFQVFFLDEIYQFIKTRELKSLPSVVETNFNNEDVDTTQYILDLSEDKDACIMIVNEDGGVLYNSHVNRDCVIHKLQNDSSNLSFVYQMTEENGGEYFSQIDFGSMFDNHGNKFSFANNYIASKIIESESGELCIIVNASVMPLQSTITTIQYQLVLITAIMLVFAVFMAIFMSRRISSPIKKINESAKKLSDGDYSVTFNTNGMKEVAELGTTLNYTAQELAKTEQYRNDLIANISHDMRTPLTMISGYAEVMRDIPGESTAENLQIIIDEANRLTVLVNDSLNISKMQSGKITLEPSVFNLNELLLNTANRISKMIEHEGFSIKIEAEADVKVNADYIKIEQVVYNLVSNAINYSGDDKTININQMLTENNTVKVSVTDHGQGIAPEEINNIWDRYYKIDKTHKRAVVGSGLGLYIVKSILELHNYNYGVTSKLGEGSTFWFELPLFTENGNIS